MGRYSNPDNVSRLQRILAGHDRDRLPARTTRSVQRQRRLNRNEVRELLTQYNAGLLINQLAAQFDISRTTVMKHLERAGAPRRRNLLADRLDQARQLYDQGWSLARIAKHLGLNASRGCWSASVARRSTLAYLLAAATVRALREKSLAFRAFETRRTCRAARADGAAFLTVPSRHGDDRVGSPRGSLGRRSTPARHEA